MQHRTPPVWLMGLTGASTGFVGGFIVVTLPQLLAAQRMPEATIASATALALSPLFWIFLISPILDVRFSRRWYAAAFSALAAVLIGVSVLNIHHLLVLEVAGSGMLAAGICGSMLLPVLAKRLPLRPLYIAIGAVGGVSTLCLILLPRTPGSFALAMIGENVLQSLEIACSVAIAFETIGRDNPLAATTFALASAAYALPMVYMPVVDSWGYGRGGVAGCFAIDGSLGILASLLLGLLLFLLRRFGRGWGEMESEVLQRRPLAGCSS